MTLQDYADRLAEINGECHALRATAETQKRDLTTEESEQLAAYLKEFEDCKTNHDRLEQLARQTDILTQGRGRRTEPDQPAQLQTNDDGEPEIQRGPGRRTAPVEVGAGFRPSTVAAKSAGFRNFGDFALSVHRAHLPGGGYGDRRLEQLAPTTYASEGSGGEGGYMVPTDFRTSVMEKVMGEASLLPRTDQMQVSGNTAVVPKDNGTPWGTTGIRAYWGSEGGLKTQSRPAFETMTAKLNKVYVLVPVTDELLEDAAALDSYLRKRAPEAIDFAINLAIVQGSGASQPLGILNSGALVTITKESSQLADTIVANNVIKMWSRLYAPNRANAVWLCNQDVETQLYTLALPGKDNTGAAASGWGSHVFLPAGGFQGSPYSSLFGRPLIPTQACNELGDKGDLILADLSQYLTVLKTGANPRVDVSMHLWFDYDLTAFRFVLRMTGQPWWDAPISPRDGSNTLSPFVTIEDRT